MNRGNKREGRGHHAPALVVANFSALLTRLVLGKEADDADDYAKKSTTPPRRSWKARGGS